MTTKSPGKSGPAAQSAAGARSDETQAAYLVHTLAHMLYGQLTTTHPWLSMYPYMSQGTPYTMPNVPYTMPQAPYPTPHVSYATPSTPYTTPNTPYTTPRAPYAMPNVVPQSPFGSQYSMSWAPFYTACCGFVPGQLR